MYFSELQSFGKNALGMIQSPMVLMMIVMGVLVVGLPYLIVSYPFLELRVKGHGRYI